MSAVAIINFSGTDEQFLNIRKIEARELKHQRNRIKMERVADNEIII